MRKVIESAILAATDLSEASDEVLRTAALLARKAGARLHVLHSFEFVPPLYTEHFPEIVSFPGRLELAEKGLAEQIARVVPAGVRVEPRVEMYVPHRAIAEYAEAIGADVVVLGPHSKRAINLPFLGTTADRVIRTVTMPVLVVRAPLALPLERAVAPVDLSERTAGALDLAVAWTAALAGDSPARLDVVHVMPQALAAPELSIDRGVIPAGLHREAEAALERAGAAGAVQVREEVLWSDRPADAIVEHAKEADAQLVILATHGPGLVKRALIGSTATGVARSAHCPVLLLPPKLLEAEAEGGAKPAS